MQAEQPYPYGSFLPLLKMEYEDNMGYIETYHYWCDDKYFDEQTRKELLTLSDNKEIEDRFYKNLDFGTGGLRGVVGAGTNRMNVYTVRKASQGVADYVNGATFDAGVSGIAIAYDSRRMSKEFAAEAACVFAANGITAYLYSTLMPTPVLSFTVRHLRCAAGIVITASHNPKEYNGYKVYGSDGGQITDALAGEISGLIQNVEPISSSKTIDFEKALSDGLIRLIGDDVLDVYVNNVLALSGDVSPEAKKALKVVYTPIHGTGLVPVTRVLEKAGFGSVTVVEQQMNPDTEFSTVKSPNPEEHDALALAIGIAEQQSADVVIATDPDSDRLGIAVRTSAGDYAFMNGNQLGCLLLDNCLRSRKAQGRLKPADFVVKTIVSTRMADAMAADCGIQAFNVLTGFKYIGEKIKDMQRSGDGDFIFGFEESYGYLAGTFVRDKDAVIAALLTCEAAAFCKSSGTTMTQSLDGLFKKYGYYQEGLKSYTLPGKDGMMKISALMESLRGNDSNEIFGRQIIAKEDYKLSVRTSAAGKETMTLPKSNVLRYELDNDAWLAVRPSGTEPKLKIYIGVKGETDEDSQAQTAALMRKADEFVGPLGN